MIRSSATGEAWYGGGQRQLPHPQETQQNPSCHLPLRLLFSLPWPGLLPRLLAVWLAETVAGMGCFLSHEDHPVPHPAMVPR